MSPVGMLPSRASNEGDPLMPTILQNHYVLAVQDARAAAKFYVEALGFRIVDEPPKAEDRWFQITSTVE
jgi:hypothetical protein